MAVLISCKNLIVHDESTKANIVNGNMKCCALKTVLAVSDLIQCLDDYCYVPNTEQIPIQVILRYVRITSKHWGTSVASAKTCR